MPANKPTSESLTLQANKCQSIYWNLIQAQYYLRGTDVGPLMIVREWMIETERCDQFHNMADVRKNFERKLGDDSVGRILACEQTKKDEDKAAQAVMHLDSWHTTRLVEGLTIFNQAWYYSVFQWDKFLFAVGLYKG
jgi:hypothetical protein